MPEYKRVLLKLSGEALKGGHEDILDNKVLYDFAKVMKQVVDLNVQVGIVVGGGNIWRGRVASEFGLDRANADYMGMTATIINALVLKDILNVSGIKAEATTCLDMPGIIQSYDVDKANKLLDEGYVVIFGGGTGKPFLSTDTAAAMRAKDIHADALLSGKNGVDGYYSGNPDTDPNAKFYPFISYEDIIKQDLQAMDIPAIKICQENDIKIRVFNINDLENILKVIQGSTMGTYIGKEK